MNKQHSIEIGCREIRGRWMGGKLTKEQPAEAVKRENLMVFVASSRPVVSKLFPV